MNGILRSLLYAIYLSVAVLLLLELGFRIYFAVESSPRVLFYGTDAYENSVGMGRRIHIQEQYDKELEEWQEIERQFNTVYRQDRAMGGYRKFFPNELKYHRDVDSGEPFRVSINSRGFRGPEFDDKKAPGTVRILTLGASSTFGFFNRDDETYPYQFQHILNEDCGWERFEVINFAIPKATADNIRSMLIMEGIALEPDAVTFYEGRNDSDQVHALVFMGAREGGPVEHGTWRLLTGRLLVMRFIDQIIRSHSELSAEQTLDNLQMVAESTSQSFLADLEAIYNLARRHAIQLIVANQQASSQSWFEVPLPEREKLKGLTYGQEARRINDRIARGDSISGYEFNFLIHQRLMKDLEKWAADYGLPFVDIIELLDRQRHHLVSYVHLDAYANSVIARALADEIRRRFDCGKPDAYALAKSGGSTSRLQ